MNAAAAHGASWADRFSGRYVNLASPRLGARVVHVTDEFFGACERMLNPQPAVFVPGKFDDHGKWMDGWESRRKRGPGHDQAIVRLGLAGVLRGVDIDTSHFVGNHPPSASLDGCYSPDVDPADDADWREILPAVGLDADSHHLHEITVDQVVTHVRLNIYPDGGVARLRVYGEPVCDWSRFARGEAVDLVAIAHGGRPVGASGAGFGSNALNLLMPGRGIDMGDGWETPRRRGPGHDWVVLALGHRGVVRHIELDTAHYKGNYPDRASVQAADCTGLDDDAVLAHSAGWPELLGEQKLAADCVHRYDIGDDKTPVTHVRVNIFPDGGLSRVRIVGEPV